MAAQTEKLATFGLATEVDALVTSEEIGAAKPDGRIFAAALRRIDCTPEDAVMIGDSWTHDVLGATAPESRRSGSTVMVPRIPIRTSRFRSRRCCRRSTSPR